MSYCYQDLIQKLLERKPAKRLGMLSGKAQDVKRHRWFDGLDWAALEARRVNPPRKPKVGRLTSRRWATITAGNSATGYTGLRPVVEVT